MSVSVIIPLFNGEAFIQRAVESVFKQSQLPLELVIVDDASTDASLERVREMLIAAPIPVRIFRNDKNSGGPANPLNRGAREAKGELLAVLDQDDYFLPQKLEMMAAAIASAPEVRLVFSDLMGPGRLGVPALEEFRKWLPDQVIEPPAVPGFFLFSRETAIFMLLRYSNVAISFSGMIFYREDFFKKGGFDESLMIATDYDFICWIAFRYPMAYVDKVFFYKEAHEKSLSKQPNWEFEDSVVFLKSLWQAKSKGVELNDQGLQQKALRCWGVYAAKCRETGNFRAPLALNFDALSYFRFNFRGLKALLRLWSEWVWSCFFTKIRTALLRGKSRIL